MSYLVGIAGGSASGKTSVLRYIINSLPAGVVSVLSQDNYYFDRHLQQRDERGEINFDLPTAIDRVAFANDVMALRAGRSVQKKEYVFNNENANPGMVVALPAPVLVIEGLFVFHFREIADMLDLKVYIDAQEDIKLSRRLERDARERGYPESDVLYRWKHHVMPCYEQYLLPYKDECHLIISNNQSFEKGIQVLTDHLRVRAGQQ